MYIHVHVCEVYVYVSSVCSAVKLYLLCINRIVLSITSGRAIQQFLCVINEFIIKFCVSAKMKNHMGNISCMCDSCFEAEGHPSGRKLI